LVLAILDHVAVGLISHGEKMGWHFITTLADVRLDDTLGVDGKTLVGVDDNAEEARVGLKNANG
jgi:hypothetical protein